MMQSTPKLESLSHPDKKTFKNWLEERTPRQLEKITASVLETDIHRTRTTDYSNDNGFDVEVYRVNKERPFGELVGLIQVKHHSSTVGAPTVRDIVGAASGEAAPEAWVVTSSSFTGPAYDYQERVNSTTRGVSNIYVELIDSNDLYEWVKGKNDWWILDAYSERGETIDDHRLFNDPSQW